jgi:NADH-quinone oxidoreductase subunit C
MHVMSKDTQAAQPGHHGMMASPERLDAVQAHLEALLGAALLRTERSFGELSLTVVPGQLLDVLAKLRDDTLWPFQQLVDISGADYPERGERFDICYHLLSVLKNMRLRVRVQTDEETAVPSACALYPSANWFEREIWDMYGVLFEGHPDLRRILTDYGFQGFPLRKDFPLTGYVELRYSEVHKRVVDEPVKLAQDFRSFDFLSPWEGADYILPGDEKAGEKK